MKRTRHTLITAEILGFFMIIIGVLGLMTGRRVFTIAAIMLFCLILAVAAMFAVFAATSVKEHKANKTHKKK
ncbi:hypothetical protein JW898_02510 [Candidatus Woesearchaeota archaeon]|nr:hypothetical protein [Candidatus Woesearchaeota archaeon]